MTRRCAPLQAPLTRARRLMRALGAMIEVAVLPMLATGQDVPLRRAVAPALVRDEHPWPVGQALEQRAAELLGGGFVPARLDQEIEDVAVWIHGPPQIGAGTSDGEAHLIPVPLSAWPGVPPTQLIGLLLPDFHTPLPDGLVGHEDATGKPQLLDLAVAEPAAEVQPDAVTDDLSRQAVVLIGSGWRGSLHRRSINLSAGMRRAHAALEEWHS
jgi:hypothetical protein